MPGTLDSDEVIIAGNGSLWVAPIGTAVPADEDAVPGTGWVNLGYTDEDGVDITAGSDREDIKAWQELFPIRRIVTGRSLELQFKLHQWNRDTVPFAFGGGEVTEVTTGHFKYTPPAPEDVDDRMMLIDWSDGDKLYRWVIERGNISDDVEFNLVRSDSAKLSITFAILGAPGGGTPWYLLSNDPAMAPAG